MRRDARIGLAVVLVLGLAVTLLIGRALHKRAELAKDDGEAAAPTGTAQYSAEAPRVDGVDAAQVSAAAAAAPVGPAAPADTAARQPEQANPALEKFLQDQTRRMPGGSAAALQPGERAPALETGSVPAANRAPAAAPGGAAAPPGNNGKPAAGNAPAQPASAPQPDRTAWLDHETSEPPTPAAETQPPADGFGYTVVAGDNIWKISTKVYGDGKFTQKIVEANPGLNVLKMKPGTVLRIPAITHKTILAKLPSFADAKKGVTAPVAAERAKAAGGDLSGPVAVSKSVSAPDKAAASATQTTTHKIEAGDTLSAIARRYYGTSGPKTVALLAAANKGLDPAKLKIGQELTIPAKK